MRGLIEQENPFPASSCWRALSAWFIWWSHLRHHVPPAGKEGENDRSGFPKRCMVGKMVMAVPHCRRCARWRRD